MTSINHSLLQESFWINIYNSFNHSWWWLSKPGELISITNYHCNTIVNCSILVVIANSQKHNQKHCKPYQHRRQLPPTAGPPTPLLMPEPPLRVVSMLVNNSIPPEAADKHETISAPCCAQCCERKLIPSGAAHRLLRSSRKAARSRAKAYTAPNTWRAGQVMRQTKLCRLDNFCPKLSNKIRIKTQCRAVLSHNIVSGNAGSWMPNAHS